MKTIENACKQRDSSIELLRIIIMIVIIVHHYVVNSGLMELIEQNSMSINSLFLLVFGWGGKFGINCFVMITGQYMCTSDISIRKYLKLLLQIEFYGILIYLIFLATAYEVFSVKGLFKAIVPLVGISTDFTNSYLVFFG